jgi:transposase
LVPTLRHNDQVILDNIGSHKVAGVREATEAAGATLKYLPPYSPDLNPIEQAFAKLKAMLRRLALRTMDPHRKELARLPECFTSDECANFIRNAGYFQCFKVEKCNASHSSSCGHQVPFWRPRLQGMPLITKSEKPSALAP